MRDGLILLALGFASALIPVINLETYLGVRAALADLDDLVLLGFVAAVGQMIGKVVWYYVGASSLNWRIVKRKLDQPKQQARLERWRARTHDRPVIASALVLLSAVVGLPPFAIIAVIAGQLRMSLTLFVVIGLIGRWARFTGVLAGVDWALRLG